MELILWVSWTINGIHFRWRNTTRFLSPSDAWRQIVWRVMRGCFCALRKERMIDLRLLLRHHHRRMDYSWLQMYVLVLLKITTYPRLLFACWHLNCACSLLMDIFSLKAYPVEYGHIFLVPAAVNQLSCYWDKRMFGLATKIASEVNNAAFRVFFDSGAHVVSDHMFF